MRINLEPFPAYDGKSLEWMDEIHKGAWRLPDLEMPPPLAQPFNPDVSAVIPLFRDDYKRVQNIEAWARHAIYSRWTCLKYTDAVEQRVNIKFLVEECISDRVIPVFEDNFVDIDRDVLFFTAEPLEHSKDGSWGHLGKQMIPYWDKRFANYEWIFVWDADILFMPECTTKEQTSDCLLPNTMFSKINKLSKNPGYIYVSYVNGDSLRDTLLRRLAKETEKTGISVEDLLEMSGVSQNLQTIVKPSCCLWAYPAKHFHEHCQDFIEWMKTYGPYWGNDEIIAGYWTNKFGIDLNRLCVELDILVNDITYYFFNRRKVGGNILHGKINLRYEKELHDILGIV